MTNRLRPSRLSSALVSILFSLPVCAAGLGGGLEDYTPPQPPAKPKPQVVEKIVEKPVKDPATERRAQAAETDSRNKDAEIARLKAELDKARKQPPKVFERVVEKVVEKPVPVPAGDPAAACRKNGAWQAACGFAAYPAGPVFRVVGGNLSFAMGSPATEKGREIDEGPQRQVRFRHRFALAETEVTVAQYLTCVDEGGCKEPEWREAGAPTSYRERNAHLPDSPITGVSWNNAKEYVTWLSRKSGHTYTLPTEAQWEHAARGNQRGSWYFGNNVSQFKDHAWSIENAGGKLHPVGSTRLNTHPWGLKDMAGNAWEWVEDCRHDSYKSAPANGDQAWEGANGGDCSQRILRGGSWVSLTWYTRAADRVGSSADYRGDIVSFRPSRMLP
ncbi:MAG: formylglycine-generating enzyme family protein [Zoogloea sp.]|nr:formylglycine-generating enzyme family protein [Zoogloea sp.]